MLIWPDIKSLSLSKTRESFIESQENEWQLKKFLKIKKLQEFNNPGVEFHAKNLGCARWGPIGEMNGKMTQLLKSKAF